MEGTSRRAKRQRIEFGDFQTPHELARSVCQHLAGTISSPRTIVEPACGLGSFLFAAADAFPKASKVIGLDINRQYINQVRRTSKQRADKRRFELRCEDSLHVDWGSLFRKLPQPWLVVGNPPWVTNSALGKLDSRNLPSKRNVDSHRGLDAVTGKANFDISEFIMRQFLSAFAGHDATLAMLCKNSVARKLLRFAYQRGLKIARSRMYSIDAAADFGAAVEACLLVCEFSTGKPLSVGRSSAPSRLRPTRVSELPIQKPPNRSATVASLETLDEPLPTEVYDSIASPTPATRIGWHRGMLIANLDLFHRWKHLMAVDGEPTLKWRSGVKHDCAAVLELTERAGKLWNKLGEEVDIEPDCVYPFLKSSDLANGNTKSPRRWLIVPQRTLGEDTSRLASTAPRTWRYLLSHAARLDNRRSSIYKDRPRFSIFGIGDYTFSPWKVAISGLYKQLRFTPLGRYRGKPILVDDTCYFLPSQSSRNSQPIADDLNGDPRRSLLDSLIFWDMKRPITAELLGRINLKTTDAG